MTDAEILQKAVAKAEKKGFEIDSAIPSLAPFEGEVITSLTGMVWLSRYAIIFNHDFARALWGDKTKMPQDEALNDEGDNQYRLLPLWKYHLQRMVIADDPIQYLREHTL